MSVSEVVTDMHMIIHTIIGGSAIFCHFYAAAPLADKSADLPSGRNSWCDLSCGHMYADLLSDTCQVVTKWD